MTSPIRINRVARTAIFAALVASGASPALAQSTPTALPTAPGADRAAAGGLTQAPASLPGDGGSPLKPYLYLAILAGGGIIAAIGAISSDRHARSVRPARR